MVIFGWASLILMPIFAFLFIYHAFRTLQKVKQNVPLGGYLFLSSVFFALMIWTISGTLLLTAH